MDDATLKI